MAKGDKPIKISWNYPGKDSNFQAGITITPVGDKTSLLTISSVMGEHNGNYTCIATNPAGSISHTAEIHVNGT